MNLRPEEDQPSASPPPEGHDGSDTQISEEGTHPDTVLLVEDNPTDVFVIKKVLKEYSPGLLVRVAKDGQEALRYLRESVSDPSAACPALVLLDLNIPKFGGLEILRELRSGPKCNLTPVIIVTSSGAEGDRLSAESLKANGYFKKPTSVSAYKELGQLIKKVLDAGKQGVQ